ncbi:MAG: protein kinase domain-containing protein [Planctomycetota bacterium]|jgi:acyl-CoA hydrolase
MELVEGENVLAILKREGKVDPQRSLNMMGQLCDALGHAHAHNIVHQDIKPQNLMIDRRQRDVVKLADLGLAKVIGQEKGQRRGLLMGTPHYMAPEQAKAGTVDGRTDIYSAGATLFHMLTGRVPYDGRNSIEILTKHVKNDIPDPRQYDVSIPESVARLTMHMMAKDRAKRPQSVGEVAEKIKEVVSRETARFQKVSAPGRAAAVAAKVVPRRQLRRAVRQRRSSPSAMPWVLVALCIAALTAVWILKDWGSGKRENGSKGSGLTAEQAGKYFERARYYEERGNYVEAENLLIEIARKAPGTAWERRANAQIVQISELRGARRRYAQLVEFMRRHPQALRTAKVQLEKFIRNNPTAPEIADARSQLARVEEELAKAAGGATQDPAVTREQEAQNALKNVKATADALEARREFFAAERALLDFAAMFSGTKAAEEAKNRAKALRGVGGDFMKTALADAKRHSAAKRYQKATELFSQIISADPAGEWGRKAREALAAQDAATKAAFDKGWGGALTAFKAFEFRDSANLAGRAAGELTSTRWQRKLERLATDALLCGKMHADMLTVIDDYGQKMPCPFRVKGPTGTHRGQIVGVSHEAGGVRVEGGPATIVVKWKDMKPAEMATVYLAYKVPAKHHLAAGILFAYHGLKEKALAELRRARASRSSRDEAERRMAELEGRANLLSYDFSGGLQMLDWNARAGTWGIKDGALTGGGTGESVIGLSKTRYSARGLVLSFEFKLRDAKNVFTAELYGSDNDYVGVVVDPRQSLALVSAVGGTPLTRMDKVTLGAGKRHTIRVAVKGDQLVVTADGRDLPALRIPRVDRLSGVVRFKVLDGEVALDNIEVRNAAE